MKKVVADQALALHPQGCSVKKLLRPASCREDMRYVQMAYSASKRPCGTLSINRGTARRSQPPDHDVELRVACANWRWNDDVSVSRVCISLYSVRGLYGTPSGRSVYTTRKDCPCASVLARNVPVSRGHVWQRLLS